MTRRYPLAPLFAVTGWSMSHVTQLVPCNGSEYRLRRAEGVTERTADRLAVAAGLHPWALWPEMEAHAAEDAERAAEQRRERIRQVARDSARKRYWEDEEIRQKRLENARRYREENRDYVLAEQRRRRQRDLDRRRQKDREYYQRNREQILARLRERRKSAA